MHNIKIGRFDQDPQAQGVIKPADGSWQLVIDKDGYPHLYVRTKVTLAGEVRHGLLCIEDMLPEHCTIKDLMDGEFGDELSPEEEDEAYQEYLVRKEQTGIPCPR